ncbi:unnamed protein product [Paramecium primaurelia]|uniref:CHY-type domain-containing protein n=1 Tax=Paramecium primaurelia TaxID=5886 RepID=A0A8S1Q5F7_PARPR|nr:unnamed protein product [Paramecium primaurelia]
MSDIKITPRQHGRSKTKTIDNIQVQYKKAGITNDRLVVNKLGLKFDPVCWKKTHEKGRIQYVCIEKDCKADRRLACAHCIIEEHDQHVSNKITVEQYCEAFEYNYKQYVLQVAKMEENYKKCKMIDVIEQIDQDMNTIFEILKYQLKTLRDKYIKDMQTYSETTNATLIQNFNDERQILLKMKEYANKNLYEMTPAEMDHSLLLIGSTHIEQIINKLTNFEEQGAKITSTMKAQWKWIYEELEEKLREVVSQVGQYNLNVIQLNETTGKRTPIDSVNILLQDQKYQDMTAQYTSTTNKSESIHMSTFQRTNYSQQPLLKLQPIQLFQQFQSVDKQSNKPNTSKFADSISENSKQLDSPKEHTKSIRQVAGSSDITSPLKSELNQKQTTSKQNSLRNLMLKNHNQQLKDTNNQIIINNNCIQKQQTQIRQISPNGMNYYYQSDGKKLDGKRGNHLQSQSSQSLNQQSLDKRLSAQKFQSYHFTCNNNSMKCIHNDIIRAYPIFTCCNQAYPCYECHDQVSNHKAHITIPSQRYCLMCKEIFSVNLLSTVDVKCYHKGLIDQEQSQNNPHS